MSFLIGQMMGSFFALGGIGYIAAWFVRPKKRPKAAFWTAVGVVTVATLGASDLSNHAEATIHITAWICCIIFFWLRLWPMGRALEEESK